MMTPAQRDAFDRHMKEANAARGIEHAASAPLPATGAPHPNDSLGLEQAARRKWESDPSLRVEFGDSFERYLAFYKADRKGLVKILSREA